MKFAIKPHDITHLTLGVLLHYLEKLKIQNFCRYSAIIPDMEENKNKLRIKCTDFNSSTRVTVYAECTYVFFIKILSSSLNTVLIIDKHCSDVCCDEFPMPQIDRLIPMSRHSWTWNNTGIVRLREGKEAIILWSHHEKTRKLPGERVYARNNA